MLFAQPQRHPQEPRRIPALPETPPQHQQLRKMDNRCEYCNEIIPNPNDDWGLPPHFCVGTGIINQATRRRALQDRFGYTSNGQLGPRPPIERQSLLAEFARGSSSPGTPTRTMEVSGGPTLADRIIDLAENLNRLQQQLREIWIMAEAEDTNRRWEEKRRRRE